MFKYEGSECPVCESTFTCEDDIVVCPDCGTPHHRHCYMKYSSCKNTGLHCEGFIWRSSIENAIHKSIEDEISRIAKYEQNLNSSEHEISNEEKKFISDFNKLKELMENNSASNISGNNKNTDHDAAEKRDVYDIFGVSEREIAYFQNNSNPFLIDKYRRMAAGKIVSFNFFALFLFPYIAFYSRMRVIGILVSVFDFILRIPYTLLVISYDLSFMNLNSVSEIIESNEVFLTRINSVFGFIQLILRIASLTLYDYIYLRWMAYKIKIIRTSFPQGFHEGGSEYKYALKAAGKPSFFRMLFDTLGVFCALLTILLLTLYYAGYF